MTELCLGEIACPHCTNHSMPYEVVWHNEDSKTIHCETCKSVFEITFKVVEVHEPNYGYHGDIGG